MDKSDLKTNAFYKFNLEGVTFDKGEIESIFVKCSFRKVKFINTNIYPGTIFDQCDFRESNIESVENFRLITFIDCIFDKTFAN